MKIKLLVCLILISCSLRSQYTNNDVFTKKDTLRATNNEMRNWWKLLSYNITINPDFSNKSIKGKNTIKYEILSQNSIMQIDLQKPINIDSIYVKGEKYEKYIRKGNYYEVNFSEYIPNYIDSLTIYFSGKPLLASNPPWDGGWIFAIDYEDKQWITTVGQSLGISAWLPSKDYHGEEPEEGIKLTIITERNLKGIGNGKLIDEGIIDEDKKYYTWKVENPINGYSISPYVGDYINFSEVFSGEKGDLALNYWVHPYNLSNAKKQFKQVPMMLEAFEYWFGPYPFYKDGYKLVESPYLGMELQSNIAYGNGFQNGYFGRDLSSTGEGFKWDFIIVHESAHEWFGNSITHKDAADMWVHESFANYAEVLFTEYHFGKESADKYLIGLRNIIRNDIPIIGKYEVGNIGSGDMYFKGANMIHTIRQIINNDDKFRKILRGMNEKFYHKIVTTQEIENYISNESGIDFSKIFDQYLRTIKIPTLEYYMKNRNLFYKWVNVVEDFNMKIETNAGILYPTEEWKKIKFDKRGENRQFVANPNYYIFIKKS